MMLAKIFLKSVFAIMLSVVDIGSIEVYLTALEKTNNTL